MIKLEIEAIDATHLRKQLAEFLSGATVVVHGDTSIAPLASAPAAEAPKRGRPPKAAETLVAVTPTDESQTTEVGNALAGAEASRLDETNNALDETNNALDETNNALDEPHALTYDGDIKPAVLKVSAHDPAKGGGREGVLALMAQFDVPHINKVPEEKWPELLDAINLVLEG